MPKELASGTWNNTWGEIERYSIDGRVCSTKEDAKIAIIPALLALSTKIPEVLDGEMDEVRIAEVEEY
jgi:hypothetical protein